MPRRRGFARCWRSSCRRRRQPAAARENRPGKERKRTSLRLASWERKRQYHTKKRFKRTRAQVLRSFDDRAGNVFECSIDGQKNKWRINVREHKNHREGAVKKEAHRCIC